MVPSLSLQRVVQKRRSKLNVTLLAKGMKPEMARLTLARKIAAIALTLWKKEERFDAEQLKPQAA